MNNGLIVRLLVVLALFFSLATQAWATDDIICTSKNFKASLAVGSDGYVVSMVLSNTSGNYFPENLEITSLKKRHVSIINRAVNIEAALELKSAKKLVIWLKRGKGYIYLNSYREKMTCDWDQ
jgi:hypothetical protein